MTDMIAFEREVATEVVRDMGPSEPVDDLAIFEAVTASRRSRRWEFTPFAALRFAVAAAIVALFGGFLLAGVLTAPQGDDVLPAAVTEAPSPMTAEELLSGMVATEVEPGVYRVEDDGVRSLSPMDGSPVVAGDDGSVWLAVSGGLVRLGGTRIPDPRTDASEGLAIPDPRTDASEGLADLEIASDGRAWAVVVQGDETSRLLSFDGETWKDVALPDYEPVPSWAKQQWQFIEVTSSGRVWVVSPNGAMAVLEPDGATWQTIEEPVAPPWITNGLDYMAFIGTDTDVLVPQWRSVWHYADGVWDEVAYGDPDTGAMPDDVFWAVGQGATGSGEILHRFDGTSWRQWAWTSRT